MKQLPKTPTLRKHGREYCWETASIVFICAILFLFPLLPGTQGYINLTETKYTLFKVFTLVYGGFCLFFLLVLLVFNKPALRDHIRAGVNKPNISQILIFLFAVWGVVCALLSPYEQLWEGQSRYEGVLSMLLYAAIFILLSFWGVYKGWYVRVLNITAIIFASIAILQMGGSDIIFPEGYYYCSQWPFLSTIGNIDCVSGLIAILLPFLSGLYLVQQGRPRFFCLVSVFLLLFIELRIDVDSGVLGLVGAFVLVLPLMLCERSRCIRSMYLFAALLVSYALTRLVGGLNPISFRMDRLGCIVLIPAALLLIVGKLLEARKKEPRPSSKAVLFILYGLELLAAAAAVYWLYGYQGGNVMLYEVKELLHGRLDDYAGNMRGFVWKDCITLMKNSPIFGYGPGSFLSAFGPYNREEIVNQIYDFAHNDYLQIGVSTGFVGLGLYLAFLISLAVRAFRQSLSKPILIGFIGAAVGFLVHVFFSFSIAILSPVFWAVIGIMDHVLRDESLAIRFRK